MAIQLEQRARQIAWRAKHRARPLKAAIHGACQADALRRMLDGHPACAGQLEFFPLEENFKMTDADLDQFVNEIAPQLDVFIFQPDRGLGQADRFSSFAMVQHLRADCLWVSFPMFRFEVYSPFYNYPLSQLGKTPYDYVDFAVVAEFLKGTPEQQVAERIAAIELDDAQIDQLLNWAYGKIEARETGEMGQVDVLVSPFVRRHVREQKLFHTINHPGLAVMSHIAEGVLDRLHELGALDRRYGGEPFEDRLDQIRLPLHRSIQRSFDLPEDREFFHKGRVIPEHEAIATTYRHLAGLDRKLLQESLEYLTAQRPWFAILN